MDAAATTVKAEADRQTALDHVMGTKMARRYAKTTKLSRVETEILFQWFEGKHLDPDLVKRFIKRYEREFGADWSVGGDYQNDEVVVGTLASVRFERVKILSVWGNWMMAGGVNIYLVDVDPLDRQLLCFYDSIVECSCASRLSTFTTDAIKQELRRVVSRVYCGEDISPWDDCESILVSKEEIINWRAEMFKGCEEL